MNPLDQRLMRAADELAAAKAADYEPCIFYWSQELDRLLLELAEQTKAHA